MKAIQLLSYKNWSIKIQCDQHEDDAHSITYTATAIVMYERHNAASEARNPERFIATLPGVIFVNPADAKLALLGEAKRRINALPIHLPAALAGSDGNSRAK